MFQMEIGTFSGKAQFAQRVTLTARRRRSRPIEWMICDDTSCMPPEDTELTITLPETPQRLHRSRPGNPGNRHRRTRGEGCRRKRFDSGL